MLNKPWMLASYSYFKNSKNQANPCHQDRNQFFCVYIMRFGLLLISILVKYITS
jgi:hypothetical protein